MNSIFVTETEVTIPSNWNRDGDLIWCVYVNQQDQLCWTTPPVPGTYPRTGETINIDDFDLAAFKVKDQIFAIRFAR